VHGDEIGLVHTIQTVVKQLDPARMSGTVLAVLDVSRPALEAMERRWPNSGRGVDLIDINREWPGNENGPSAPSRHAGLLFNRLLRPNADYAIDFHTGTTGMDLTSFNLARMELPEARAMAEVSRTLAAQYCVRSSRLAWARNTSAILPVPGAIRAIPILGHATVVHDVRA
jgi:uncharacterized protein